ncbi:MAG TPA: hypothetical protein VNJ52_03960 [Patescibacteria group bacterium]|nr:hypothetical protein [Patescibacteria group bacterium]
MKGRFFQSGWIAYPLRKPFGHALFALAIALAVLPAGYEAVRIGAASMLGALGKPADIRLAMAFDPADPALDERMGRIGQTALEASPAESVPWFRKAAALEPGNGWYWESLGLACEFAGERRCATSAFSRALSLDPMAPRALWLAANHELLIGSDAEALSHFRRLLAMDSGYAEAVFAVCLRAYGNPQLMAARILPASSSPALKLAFVNFLARRSDFQPADRFWSGLASGHARFDFSLADPYLEKLISSGRIAQAARVWRDLRRLGILPAGGGKTGNLVFNPGFESPPLNAGFGWRLRTVPYVDAEFADPSAHGGMRCLRIDYAVAENEASEPVYELIPVSGDQTYRLIAWVRSRAISSDSGPRLRVVDPQHAACPPAQTESAEGTTPWHEVSVTFSTCAQTNLVRLSLWRPRGDEFPNRISGHFWLDDVSLKPVSKSSLPPSRDATR